MNGFKNRRPLSIFPRLLPKGFLKRVLFAKKETESSHFYFKCFFYAVLLVWGLSFFDETDFAGNPYGGMDSFLHYIHLPFHEAGHIIFNFLGEFMGYFGGTLMQCLVPLAILFHFFQRKDNFSASVGLWWLGHSFLDIAPYIYDAWDQKLTLLGGGTGRDQPGAHDWRYLLSAMGELESYAEIAWAVGFLGKCVLTLAFLWGGIILYKQFLDLWSRGFKSAWELEDEPEAF